MSGGSLSATSTGAQSFTSLIGDIAFSGTSITLKSSNTSVAVTAGRQALFTGSTSSTGSGSDLSITSSTGDVVLKSTAASGVVSITATNGTVSATAGRSVSIASPFGTNSIQATKGDVSFTQTQSLRWLASNVNTVTANNRLVIRESGSIMGTADSTNDITISSAKDSTWQSQDLLVTGSKVSLLPTTLLSVSAGQSIFVRTEQQLPVTMVAQTTSQILSPSGSISVFASQDTSVKSSTTNSVTASKAVQVTAGTQALLDATTAALTFSTTNMTLGSMGDITMSSRTGGVSITSGSDLTIVNQRSFLANGGTLLKIVADNVTFTGANTLRVDASQFSATGVVYSASSITTAAGTFSQSGGAISLSTADALKLEASKRTILAGDTNFDLSTPFNVTFLAHTGIWSARNLIATASGTRRETSLRLKGSSVLLYSDSGNDIQVASAQRVLLTSGNAQPITFTGVSDRLVSASSIDVQARGAVANAQRNNTRESVWFESTKDGADIVVFSSGGALNLRAPNLVRFNSSATGFFTANGLVTTVDDISVVTKATDNAGGINMQSYGVTHDPIYGTDTGISLHSEDKGDVILKSEKNRVIIVSQTNADLLSTTGPLEIFTGSDTTFNSGMNTNIIADEGSVSLVAQLNDVTIAAGKDFDVQTTRNASFVAQGQVTLQSTQRITDPNNVALEFGSDSGDLKIAAQGLPSVIAWTSAADTAIEAGGAIGITANTDFSVTATTGYIQLAGAAGATVNITDGELTLRGQQNVLVQSSRNSNIGIVGGQDQRWSANGGQFSHVAKAEYVMRTTTGDLVLQSKSSSGDVLVSGINNIAFQADGTDNTVGGGGIDGIFINAQNIDMSARNTQVWEVLGSVIVGSRSNARVAIETGGDTTNNRGFTSTSEGNTVYTTQQSVTADAAYGFYINATSEVTIDTVNNVLVESLGTSAVGKDVNLESLNGQFYMHGVTANLEAKQSAAFQSGGVLQVTSVGVDQVNNQLKLESGNVFNVDVDRRWKVDAGTWNTLADAFDAQIDNEVVLRTTGGSSSNLQIASSELLQFASDYSATVTATGSGVSLTFDAYSPNSPIEMSAEDSSSRMLLTSSGALSATAATSATVSGQLGIDIVAYDNSLTGTAGDVSFDTYGTFEVAAGNRLDLQGSKGVTLTSTAGVKDIELSSTGATSMLSRQSTSVRAERGDLQVTSGRHLEFNTISDSQNGSIALSSATHLDIHTHLNADIVTDKDDFSISAAQNVLFVVERAGATFRTTKTDASVVVQNAVGGIDATGFTGVALTGGHTDFTASRKIILSALDSAGSGITLSSNKLHSTLRFRANSTPFQQDNTMYVTSSTKDVQLLAPSTATGQGWIDIDSLSTVSFTASSGPISLQAPRGSVRTNAGGNVLLTASSTGTVSSKGAVNGIGISVRTTDSTLGAINVSTVGAFSFSTSAGNLTVSGTSNTSPGSQVSLNAATSVNINLNGNAKGRSFEAYSSVPGSPVTAYARNIITGQLNILPTGSLQIDGNQGVLIAVPEGIDEGDVFTSKFMGSQLSMVSYGGDLNELTGAREGVIIKTVLDSTIYFHPTSTLTVRAADSLYATALNAASVVSPATVTVNAFAGLTLQSFTQTLISANAVTIASTNNLRMAAASIALNPATTTTISVGVSPITSLQSEEPMLLQAQRSVTFTGRGVSFSTDRNQLVDITSDSILRIPFIFPRDGGFNNILPTSGGCASATLYGGAGSFFYNPRRQKVCYCTYALTLVCF
jgi:hypothetical protein